MEKNRQLDLLYFALSLTALLLLQSLWHDQSGVETISYSEFLQLLDSQQLSNLSINQQRRALRSGDRSRAVALGA